MIPTLKEDDLSYLVGGPTVAARPLAPYNPLAGEFLNDLATELRADRRAAEYPDIMTLAFWCRRANIAKLKAEYEDGKARLGRGLVFHIAPSNVPINFAFSFIFGLLSGNANIVKLPLKPYPQVEIICAAMNRLFLQDKYGALKEMTAFVSYNNIDEITAAFSAGCQARIIWGGDKTVAKLRQIPIPVRSVEIAFSDRYSFCALAAPAVNQLAEADLARLAERFFNDTYLMDQNACSSPHLLVWLGEEKAAAKGRFWPALHRLAVEKYRLPAVTAVDKYTQLCHDAIELDSVNSFHRYGSHVYRVTLDRLPQNMDALRGQSGYFYEYDATDMNGITHIVNAKYQTLAYFGVDKSELQRFVLSNQLLGIDRIVPIGSALDIGVIWDGYDIVKSLSRIVDVK